MEENPSKSRSGCGVDPSNSDEFLSAVNYEVKGPIHMNNGSASSSKVMLVCLEIHWGYGFFLVVEQPKVRGVF